VTLYERALDALPAAPDLHRALADPTILPVIDATALRFGYTVHPDRLRLPGGQQARSMSSVDEQAGDRILKLHHSIDVRVEDGDPHGVLPGLYFLLATEYAQAGQWERPRPSSTRPSRRRRRSTRNAPAAICAGASRMPLAEEKR